MRKMSVIRRDNRGQISAEYLLLFVVILTVFLFMIVHFIGPTIDASNNVSLVSDSKIVVESIADAVNVVYANGPGAKRTLNVNVPQDVDLTFDSTNHVVETSVNLSGVNSTNLKFINAPMNYNGIINPSTTPDQLSLDKGWRTVQIYWNNSGSDSSAIMEVTQVS
jgi:uncharacterized protein (UPF0333 family)